jgi:glyoxylase I family protein
MPDRRRPVAETGVSHIGLSVTDLDRSIAFYVDVLGAQLLRPPYDSDRGSFRMAVVMFGPTGLDLCQHDANQGEGFVPARTGLDHLALTASSEAELEAWARWLDDNGIDRSEIRDAQGAGSIFDFLDPDGVQLEFFFLDPDKLARSATWAGTTAS